MEQDTEVVDDQPEQNEQYKQNTQKEVSGRIKSVAD